MEERIKISMLLDLYEGLLTDKQRDIMDLYFNDDLSLVEISEITNTSRQAVFDTIKRCEKSLLDYESKLKLFFRNEKVEEIKNAILSKVDSINENTKNDEILLLKKEIENYILELI
jgi:predicted DNA-binding protein YlxM (UPF0122 family)